LPCARVEHIAGDERQETKAVIASIALLTFALAGQALAQGQEIEYKSNADDLMKIRGALEEFRQDIMAEIQETKTVVKHGILRVSCCQIIPFTSLRCVRSTWL
jgi:hypothetical protein